MSAARTWAAATGDSARERDGEHEVGVVDQGPGLPWSNSGRCMWAPAG